MTETFEIKKYTFNELKAILEKHHPHVVLNSSYKYSFTYIGRIELWFDTTPEYFEKTQRRSETVTFKFTCETGGDADDIYRFESSVDYPLPVFPENNHHFGWNYIKVEAMGAQTNYKWVEICDEELRW